MQIEITDEQIEQINKYFIHDKIREVINVEVSKRVNDSIVDIPKLVSSLASKELAEKITDNIGYNIAYIFAEKYED